MTWTVKDFTRRYRYKTVKDALEKAFSNPECIRVYLKSKKKFSDGKGEFYQIGYAETLESALRTFGGFLNLKAELDDEDRRIAHVFVNGDDVIRIKVENRRYCILQILRKPQTYHSRNRKRT